MLKANLEASVLEAFKLDHLQPVKLILSQQNSIILIFILAAPISYYPRERKEGSRRRWKWGKGIHPKMDVIQRFLYTVASL